ncbi:MAG: hypothetical protein ACXW29_10720 [Thermoanaerobaculia bacterium]
MKLIFLLLLAAAIAVTPALHNHSLIPTPGTDFAHPKVCAVCVAASARIVTPAPVLGVPVVVTLVRVPAPAIVRSADSSGPVPSRAPPIA